MRVLGWYRPNRRDERCRQRESQQCAMHVCDVSYGIAETLMSFTSLRDLARPEKDLQGDIL